MKNKRVKQMICDIGGISGKVSVFYGSVDRSRFSSMSFSDYTKTLPIWMQKKITGK